MAIRTVTRRGATALVFDFYYRDADGRRRRVVRRAKASTHDEALAEEAACLSALAPRSSVPPPCEADSDPSRPVGVGPTVRDAVEAFRRSKAHALKPSTLVAYEKFIEGLLLPMLGNRPLEGLGSAVFLELDAASVARGLSVSSRRNYASITRSVLRCAHDEGLLGALPAPPRLPTSRTKVVRVPTEDEFARVIAALPEIERVAFALAYYAGLRAGEIRGLRRADVALAHGEIRITRAICRGVAAPPKSGHARLVPIAAPLREYLDAALASPGRSNDAICLSRTREPWTEDGLRNALLRAQRATRIVGWTFHSLRHAFVSRLFARGVSAPVVQALAGHLHLSVTQRYAHSTADQLRAAVDRMPRPQIGSDSATKGSHAR
jgi:integrase